MRQLSHHEEIFLAECPDFNMRRNPAVAIACHTKDLLDLLLATGRRAAPRLSSANAAAGPWRFHQFLAHHWNQLDAAIFAECLAEILVENGETPQGRPHSPFTAHPDGKAAWVSFPYSFSTHGDLTLVFDPELDAQAGVRVTRTEQTCCMYFSHSMIQQMVIPPASQTVAWLADTTETIAHELSHIWQQKYWRAAHVAPNTLHSLGGGNADRSPHALRPMEVFAYALGHAAYLAISGLHPHVKDHRAIVSQLSMPGTAWRKYWVEWLDREYAVANPAANRAARMYHRILRSVLPAFVDVLAPTPPVLESPAL